MANLKNITDLPMAASAEGLNLIVNDNGTAKQIVAGAVCKVKSVNGVEPDESGNVQIDTASSWNDLKDKPFYSETDEDGNETIHKLDAKYLPDDVGGEQMDIALHVNGRPSSGSIAASNVEIVEGSMEAVRMAVAEGRVPKGKIVFETGVFTNEYGVYGHVSECTPAFYLYGGYIYMSCIVTDGLNSGVHKWMFRFNEDGIIESVSHVE